MPCAQLRCKQSEYARCRGVLEGARPQSSKEICVTDFFLWLLMRDGTHPGVPNAQTKARIERDAGAGAKWD